MAGRGLRHVRWAKRFLTFSGLPEEAAFRRSYTLYDQAELVDLIDPKLGREVDDVIGEHLEIYCDTDLSDHVNRMCLADARLFLTGLNLTYTDRASMAASTEVRVPFVDPIVFQAAFSLSADRKIRGRTQKVALKEAALAWLPPEIVHRPKASFSAPLRAWISHDLRGLVDEALVRRRTGGSRLPADAVPWRRSSAMTARGVRTDRSRSGNFDPRDLVPADAAPREWRSDLEGRDS